MQHRHNVYVIRPRVADYVDLDAAELSASVHSAWRALSLTWTVCRPGQQVLVGARSRSNAARLDPFPGCNLSLCLLCSARCSSARQSCSFAYCVARTMNIKTSALPLSTAAAPLRGGDSRNDEPALFLERTLGAVASWRDEN